MVSPVPRGDNADEVVRLRDALADAEHQRDRWCADAASWERRADELAEALADATAGRCRTCHGSGVITVPDPGGESASEQACLGPIHNGGSQPAPARHLTPHDLADQAIGLFLEYRDQHGHDEESARVHAVLEVVEGAAVTDEELAGPGAD